MKGLTMYKPRYRIAHQLKNKIWPYKDSRLRRFYNIRGRKLIRGGLFKRIFMVFNNMKWNIARRYIRPNRYYRKGWKRKYKHRFYAKQQLKHFYGKFKEEYFCNFFKKYSGVINHRNKSFYSALERRVDMFLYRTRMLPTIYAANQYIHHQGVNINGRYEKSPNALIRPGDVLSFSPEYWSAFTDALYLRIFFRTYGLKMKRKRFYHRLKKKGWRCWRKNRARNRINLNIIRQFWLYKRVLKRGLVIVIKKLSEKYIEIFKDNKMKNTNEARLNYDQMNKIYCEYKRFCKSIHYKRNSRVRVGYRRWIWKNFYKTFFILILRWYKICKKILFIKNQIQIYYLVRDFQIYTENSRIKINTFKKEKNLDKEKKIRKDYDEARKIYKQKREQVIFQTYLFLWKLKKILSYIIKRKIQSKIVHKKKYKMIKEENMPQGEKKGAASSKATPIFLRRNALYFHLKYKKYRTTKRRAIIRLKPVHWHIPSYIYFNLENMLGIFLHNPLPEEIQYSFKCSLSGIYSFYKSRGY